MPLANDSPRTSNDDPSNLDLAPVKRKLMSADGPNWTDTECELAIGEYRRFLRLLMIHPHEDLVPNLAIDEVWHHHILDTKKYHDDTHRLFGHYLHHDPSFGGEDTGGRDRLVGAFSKTKNLYQSVFGVEMLSPVDGLSGAGASCGRSCMSSCKNG